MLQEGVYETINRHKFVIVCCILYCLSGLFLLLKYDNTVGILYFTTIPITFLIVYKFYRKTQNFSVAVYLFFVFLSQGVNPFLFFMHRDNYETWGYGGIGNFDFSLFAYYKMFLQVIVVSLVIIGVSVINKPFLNKITSKAKLRNKKRINFTIKLQNEKIRKTATLLCMIICVLGCCMSIFMYNNQIGVLGFESIKLPFRMVGILYYTRLLILNGCVLGLYILSQNKYLIVPICIYSYIITLSSNSKLCGLCVLVFIILYELLNRNMLRAALLMMYSFVVYDVLNYTRYFIFSDGGGHVNPLTGRTEKICHTFDKVIIKSFFNMQGFILNLDDKILEVLHSFTSRLYGSQMLVIGSQYRDCTFEDFICYLRMGSIYQVKPNILQELLKIQVETMGFAFGHIGDLIILGSGNVLQLCLIAVVIGILLNTLEIVACMLSTYIESDVWNLVLKFICIVLIGVLWLSLVSITFIIKVLIGGIVILFLLFLCEKLGKQKYSDK